MHTLRFVFTSSSSLTPPKNVVLCIATVRASFTVYKESMRRDNAVNIVECVAQVSGVRLAAHGPGLPGSWRLEIAHVRVQCECGTILNEEGRVGPRGLAKIYNIPYVLSLRRCRNRSRWRALQTRGPPPLGVARRCSRARRRCGAIDGGTSEDSEPCRSRLAR